MQNAARHMPHAYGHARGMAWIDTLIGLTLVVALTFILVATHNQHRKTAKAMAERREAVRQLEHAAYQLEQKQTLESLSIASERIDDQWVHLVQPLQRGEIELIVFRPKSASTSIALSAKESQP